MIKFLLFMGEGNILALFWKLLYIYILYIYTLVGIQNSTSIALTLGESQIFQIFTDTIAAMKHGGGSITYKEQPLTLY